MKTKYVLLLVIVLLSAHAHAQMWNGQDTLYGNEWINYDQSYFKIPVVENGIYRLSREVMEAAGVPLSQIQSSQLQLFHQGEEQALYASNNGVLTDGDYIEFYGEKNRSEVDQYLFESIDSSMLNPWYSLVTDTAVYYLTWNEDGTSGLRYETINNDLTNLPLKEEWYWAKSELFYTNDLRKIYTKISGASVYYSRYGGEGFASDYAEQHDLNLATPGFYDLGPESSLNLRFVSNANDDGHNLEVRWNDGLIAAETYFGAQIRSYNIDLNTSSLSNSNSLQIRGLNNNDSYAVGGAIIRYPRTFNADGATFLPIELPASNGDRYLEIDAVGAGTQACFLYDQTNRLRLESINEDGVWKAKFPTAIGERHLIAFTAIQTIGSIQAVEFVDLTASEGEYLILTSEKLRDNGQGTDYVQQYADYRNTAIGGAYNVKIVNVETLYDQYAYGVERHPIAIRNFVHLAQKEWQNLKYCFLIGKGQEYNAIRNQADLEAAISEGFFHLPSYGWPASDNLMMALPGEVVPSLAVGRIAVINGDEVGIYLNKVESMEANFNNPQTIEDRAWMKNILHLGGGSSASEQSTIKAYLENMAAEIRRNKYGGNIKAFYKTSADPIQTSLTDQIFNTINEGTSIITFFGHSSPGTFDFNIDNPDNYINAGKYPLMLSLGCYSGNVFVDGRSIGERFTFYENKATVAFGASRGLGFISSLGNFARSYYAHLGGAFYGEGIGDALLATLDDHKNNPFIGTATLVEQFTLHADPAIRLYPTPGPDYVLDPTSVSFLPEIVTADQDSFGFNIDVLNLGQNIPDTVVLRVLRKLPNNNLGKEVVRDTVALNQFRHSFSYQIPTEGRDGVGENLLLPIIDVANDVEELPYPDAEGNNFLKRSNGEDGIPLFIIDNTARPVHPYEFVIVGEAPITLKASTTDALAPERTYLLEIDTTALFNSPQKRNTSITQKGGVIEWTPSVNWQDSTVYYWRISPDSTSVEVGYVWEESSFVYIEGSEEGWRQGAYWQFRKNVFDGTILSGNTRSIDFNYSLQDMTMYNRVYGINPDEPPYFSYANQNPAGSVRPWLYLDAGLSVLVGDERTTSFWRNVQGYEYDSVDPPNKSTYSYDTTTPEGRQALINLLQNEVPEGYYVFVFSVQNGANADYQPENWAIDSIDYGQNLFQVLEEEGAVLTRNLTHQGAVPYTLIYQKGRGTINEVIAGDVNGDAIGTFLMPRYQTEGSVRTPIIGPARNWGSASVDVNLEEVSIGEDSIITNVIGFNSLSGSWDTLIIQGNNNQGIFNLSSVNAETYPYLQLRYYAVDEAQRTMPALNSWNVLYEAYGEFALHAADNYSFYADTLHQGDDLFIQMEARLLSGEPDSTNIQYTILDAKNREQLQEDVKSVNYLDDITLLSHTINTKELSRGNYLLAGNLNYDTLQREFHYFNNTFLKPFYIVSDRKNPVLDVTFDGQHILDGDLVAPAPSIVIRLQDENPYFLITDTSLLEIAVTYPDGTIRRIHFNQEKVTFNPATESNKNQATVYYHPEFEESGIYRFSVQGKDLADNLSGQFNYEISFEVITENSISNILNYPNPFSINTHFIYTLTGVPPTDFRIQIATISGRIVKEITMTEIGELKVGTHRTDYAWDGTDDYGDQLANGVYLYRIIARDNNGESYDTYSGQRTGNIDRFFKNGWGKMVILR
ncbi:MAG: C25 family cysteine peptidase [Chitinophagales bacterium]|nr:C25 family cysteine peptidase [Chitinophagales bacterium]